MKKFLTVVFVMVTLTGNMNAQTTLPKAKSIYLYNFTRLLDWPNDDDFTTFTIGVYGNEEVFNQLKLYTSDKEINFMRFTIINITSTDEIRKCQMLFIGASKSNEISIIKQKIKKPRVCLVSESADGLVNGGCINFVMIDSKLKYEVNKDEISKAGLIYNSDLLKMAYSK